MSMMDRLQAWTPTSGTAGFLWQAGGWLAIGLIVVNTLMLFYAVSVQVEALGVQSDISAYQFMQTIRGGAAESGLPSAERRALLQAAKYYVITNNYPGENFDLVFVKRIENWALLEVVPEDAAAQEFRILMQKGGNGWTGQAFGTAVAGFEAEIPALFE
jgi:hypothetical protein